METHIKKEILLIILESLFRDDSSDIKSDNCISFYHFLLDTLDRELFEIPIEQGADISLCNALIELLSNFDLMNEEVGFWNSKDISDYLKDYGGLTDEEFIISISKFREMYSSIKADFLLNFP